MNNKAIISLFGFIFDMNIFKINQLLPSHIRFTKTFNGNRLIKPFELREIKQTTFLPALAPANCSCPVKPSISSFKNEKQLKEFYSYMGQEYLLPAEIWNDKKIANAINLLGKNLDILEKSSKLNKELVQKAVDKIIPQDLNGNIEVKDFSELKKDLENLGYSENEIKTGLNSVATTISYKKRSSLYINFENLNTGKITSIDLKNNVEHEMTHVLNYKLQNTKIVDYYNNECGICIGQHKVFNRIFSLLEHHYEPEVNFEPTELTLENMINWLGYYSKKDLHNSFETTLDVFTKQEKAKGAMNINNKNEEKHFYTYLKHRAYEEKIAYASNIRFRELSGDLDTPTDAELVPILYGEMEKFFAKKENDVG